MTSGTQVHAGLSKPRAYRDPGHQRLGRQAAAGSAWRSGQSPGPAASGTCTSPPSARAIMTPRRGAVGGLPGSGTPGELTEAAGIPPAATRAPLTG